MKPMQLHCTNKQSFPPNDGTGAEYKEAKNAARAAQVLMRSLDFPRMTLPGIDPG